jgi:serine/threonine protein kinase
MQNPHVDVEFRSEIKIMARIEHQSLVRFYGYMECGEERIVVVEYVPNGTLREHLDSKLPPAIPALLCSPRNQPTRP